MRIRDVEKALAVLSLASDGPMPLENLTYFVELGPTTFSPDDFVARRPVKVNGIDIGHVSVEMVADDLALLKGEPYRSSGKL